MPPSRPRRRRRPSSVRSPLPRRRTTGSIVVKAAPKSASETPTSDEDDDEDYDVDDIDIDDDCVNPTARRGCGGGALEAALVTAWALRLMELEADDAYDGGGVFPDYCGGGNRDNDENDDVGRDGVTRDVDPEDDDDDDDDNVEDASAIVRYARAFLRSIGRRMLDAAGTCCPVDCPPQYLSPSRSFDDDDNAAASPSWISESWTSTTSATHRTNEKPVVPCKNGAYGANAAAAVAADSPVASTGDRFPAIRPSRGVGHLASSDADADATTAAAASAAVDAVSDNRGIIDDDDPLNFTIVQLCTMESSDSLEGSSGLKCSLRGAGPSLEDASTASMRSSSASECSCFIIDRCEGNENVPPVRKHVLDATLAVSLIDERTDPCRGNTGAGRLGISPMIHDIVDESNSSDILLNISHDRLGGLSWQESFATTSWINRVLLSSVSSKDVTEGSDPPLVIGAFMSPLRSFDDDATSQLGISMSATHSQTTIHGIRTQDETVGNSSPSSLLPCRASVCSASTAEADSHEASICFRLPTIRPHTRFLNYGTDEASKRENNDGEKRQKQQQQLDTLAIDATASSATTATNIWNKAKLTKARTRRRKIRTLGAL